MVFISLLTLLILLRFSIIDEIEGTAELQQAQFSIIENMVCFFRCGQFSRTF